MGESDPKKPAALPPILPAHRGGPLPAQNRRAVIEARRRGATLKEAAAAGKCSVQAAFDACKKAGVGARRPRIPEREKARVAELYGQGWTRAAIGAELNRPVRSIDGLIRRRRLFQGGRRGRSGKPLPDSIRTAVLAARRRGATLESAAAAGDCSLYSAWAICKQAGLTAGNGRGRHSGPGRQLAGDLAAIVADVDAGLTPFEVAQAGGLQLTKVLEYLRSQPRRDLGAIFAEPSAVGSDDASQKERDR